MKKLIILITIIFIGCKNPNEPDYTGYTAYSNNLIGHRQLFVVEYQGSWTGEFYINYTRTAINGTNSVTNEVNYSKNYDLYWTGNNLAKEIDRHLRVVKLDYSDNLIKIKLIDKKIYENGSTNYSVQKETSTRNGMEELYLEY